MNVTRWRKPVLEGTFILTEVIAWYMVIAVMATSVERSFLSEVERRIRSAIISQDVANPAQAAVVADQLRAAAAAEAGPALLIVLLAAAGGFVLMRLVQQVDFGAALGSVVLVAATIIGLNVLLHVSFGSVRFWDAGGAVSFIAEPDTYLATGVDVDRFVADPDIGRGHGAAIAITFAGLMMVWFRFLLAARHSIGLDRMARSFTISFIVVLVTVLVARAAGYASPARYAVPQFVIGMLGLAIGNHERALPSEEASSRASPWMTSVGGTLGLLVLSGVTLGALAYLNVGAVLGTLGSAVLSVVEVILVVLITPIYWAMDRVFTWFFNGRSIDQIFPALPEFSLDGSPREVAEESEGVVQVPSFLVNTAKFFAVVGSVYLMYLVGRLLVGRRRPPPAPIEEARGAATGGAGIGQLLADLVRFRRRPAPDAWMSRHGAYQLYERAVSDATERGLRPLPAETPAEFGRAAHFHLGGQPFPRIAEFFEQVRFGRHFPPTDALRDSMRELEEWERLNPATEELRSRIGGARPLGEGAEFDLRVTLARRETLQRTDEDALMGQ
jgi:hypothetical protein